MKHLPQFPSVLAMCCFCTIQIPSSGFPQPLVHPPDGSDIVQLEQLAYCLNKWMLSKQPKFLFHYSRTQEPTHPVKTRFPPVHPLMRLAAKLASRRMKRFLQRDSRLAAVDLTKKDATATFGQPFFLFRPRNGR
uniref:Neuromedin S n=1 Tax=Chinchilla lanigera TaxID=34839 RepID=A0A8C2V089_CHILA